MWRNFAFDSQVPNDQTTSLYDGADCSLPITIVGEDYYRGSKKWKIHGVGFSAQSFGYLPSTQTRANIDSFLDYLKNIGINSISLLGFDQYGLVSSGTFSGLPCGCWTDSSFTTYNEAFFSGTGAAAGFDYFVDACCKRGLYINLRFNHWDNVMVGKGVPVLEGASNPKYSPLWHFNGEYSTHTLKTYFKDHLNKFLTRVNSVNGRIYGKDYTFRAVNVLNELGIFNAYMLSGGEFDTMCTVGGTNNALYVSAIDQQFVAWHTTKYGSGPTVNNVASTTMPCFNYSGAMGSGVAARATYKAMVSGTPSVMTQYTLERNRIATFWRELEDSFHQEMKFYVKGLSSHIHYSAGQFGYLSIAGIQNSDFVDRHLYQSTSNTTGNTQNFTGVTVTYSAGTLTVTGLTAPAAIDSNHTLAAGHPVKLTQSIGGTWTAVVTISNVLTSSSFECTSFADPGFTNITCSAILAGRAGNDSWLHREPPVNDEAGSTRVHATINGVAQNFDVSSFQGQNNWGGFNDYRSISYKGKPSELTEHGQKGWSTIAHTQHAVISAIIDEMTGTSGFYHFAVINATYSPLAGEHVFQIPTTLLCAELITLIKRYSGIEPMVSEDLTQVTLTDVDQWYADHCNSPGPNIGGATPGWADFTTTSPNNTQYHAFWMKKLRWVIGSTTAKTNVTYNFTTSGQVLPDYSNSAICRITVNRDIGYLTIESPTCQLAIGRIPDTLTLDKLKLEVPDGKRWYGVAAWISKDGTPLSTGENSVVYTMMYPKDDNMEFAALTRTVCAVITYGGASPVPGVIMRDNLRMRLTSSTDKTPFYVNRGRYQKHPSKYKAGEIYISPTQPRILLK